MDKIPVEANSYYLMDKGYVKLGFLFRHFHLNNAFFCNKSKRKYTLRGYDSREVNQSARLFSDETIKLAGHLLLMSVLIFLDLFVYEDFITNTVYHFITNNFKLEALAIVGLYRERWLIKLFFKWMKHICT